MYEQDERRSSSETAPSTVQLTAFRAAEKKYQLHLKQHMKCRKGRMRGGKLVPQPTDLSDVIDIRNPGTAALTSQQLAAAPPAILCHDGTTSTSSTSEPHGTSHAPAAAAGPQQKQQQKPCSCSSVTALTFPGHPGLTVFPAALPPLLQLQLMWAALEQWPEPPTRTNHTAQYGSQLTGLFGAAQAGLALAEQLLSEGQQQQQAGQQDKQQKCQCQRGLQQQCGHAAAKQVTAEASTEQQDAVLLISSLASAFTSSCSLDGNVAMPHSQSGCCQHAAAAADTAQQTPVPATAAAAAAAAAAASQAAPNCPATWSVSSKGPKATTLLRKLRWASLGPPFNWTKRVYEPSAPHTPLANELADIACYFADLAARSSSSVSDQAPAAGAARAGAEPAAAAAAAADRAATAAAVAQPPAHFLPDVALVNYYHAGDTLSGHRDDVERDLSQPIVTISLGCEAVFLLGGTSREQQPVALLLRSGDVVVMGGHARGCYHGVPRIFTEKGLPGDVLGAAAQHGGFDACVRQMQQSRVNISVRSTC